MTETILYTATTPSAPLETCPRCKGVPYFTVVLYPLTLYAREYIRRCDHCRGRGLVRMKGAKR